jgi:hypothetical protein
MRECVPASDDELDAWQGGARGQLAPDEGVISSDEGSDAAAQDDCGYYVELCDEQAPMTAAPSQPAPLLRSAFTRTARLTASKAAGRRAGPGRQAAGTCRPPAVAAPDGSEDATLDNQPTCTFGSSLSQPGAPPPKVGVPSSCRRRGACERLGSLSTAAALPFRCARAFWGAACTYTTPSGLHPGQCSMPASHWGLLRPHPAQAPPARPARALPVRPARPPPSVQARLPQHTPTPAPRRPPRLCPSAPSMRAPTRPWPRLPAARPRPTTRSHRVRAARVLGAGAHTLLWVHPPGPARLWGMAGWRARAR